jgi:AcrR family transcriptional regulator
LVASARALFLERGYENTSVDDVVDRAGLSKGAFYHHFRSKDELLLGLANQLVEESVALVQDLLADPALDPVGRLNAVLARLRNLNLEAGWPDSPTALLRLQRENGLLYERITEASFSRIGPLIAGVISAGANEGAFDVVDADLTAELILRLDFARTALADRAIALARSGDVAGGVGVLDVRLRGEERLLERLLGLVPGSIALPDAEALRTLLELALRPARTARARRATAQR